MFSVHQCVDKSPEFLLPPKIVRVSPILLAVSVLVASDVEKTWRYHDYKPYGTQEVFKGLHWNILYVRTNLCQSNFGGTITNCINLSFSLRLTLQNI